MQSTDSVDPAEIARFDAMAREWWDPRGKFRPLHMLNPVRLDYINSQLAAEFGRDLRQPRPFGDLDILDVGCGGGLLTVPLTRLDANCVGIDPSEVNIEVARTHARQHGLSIDYRACTVEELAMTTDRFDVVLCMEVVEHVTSPASFLAACGSLLRPQGVLVCSTLNRTARSFALAIVGAEYVLRWLPRGTHDWRKFITPDELQRHVAAAGLRQVDSKGFIFNPLSARWSLSEQDLAVNYVTTSIK